jgi:Domain of unknown function (DUF397)
MLAGVATPEPEWRRSTACSATTCVEVATIGDTIAIRDSKDPESPILSYSRRDWQAFISRVKRGEFDI